MSGDEPERQDPGVDPEGQPEDVDFSAGEGDKDDERRQGDPMAPPREPGEGWGLPCGRTFMSDQIWFQKVVGDPQGFDGFWMCPTPNCSGAGFTFDIFPTDRAHPANAGWQDDDDDGDDGDVEGDETAWEEDAADAEW